MQPTHNTVARARLIILNKDGFVNLRGEIARVEAFEEVTSIVAKHMGFDDD